MKKKILKSLIFLPLILSSCNSPSGIDKNIEYLNKFDVSFFYCGLESKIYERINNYYDLTYDTFPDSVPNLSAFVLDVNNKRGELTVPLLNKIYNEFEKIDYLYVMFVNYYDLTVIANSKFANNFGDYRNEKSDIFFFYKDLTTNYITHDSIELSYLNENEDSIENYQGGVIGTLQFQLRNDLRQE